MRDVLDQFLVDTCNYVEFSLLPQAEQFRNSFQPKEI